MASQFVSPRNHAVLTRLSCLPQKILSLHGTDNITEFVLHDIADKSCFNLKKAAFFIDNPDFDCIKGVAGFSDAEEYAQESIWEKPASFSEHMRSSNFNKKVRDTVGPSVHCQAGQAGKLDTAIHELALQVGIQNPRYHVFNMKHDNHGILVYENRAIQANTVSENNSVDNSDDVSEYIPHGACLLGLCPVF